MARLLPVILGRYTWQTGSIPRARQEAVKARMNLEEFPDGTESASIALVVRRTIHASAKQLFEAWTQPEHLKKWWGPRAVRCVGAEIDLRIGGIFRLANQFPDGRLLWIFGEFEILDPPHKLVYA